MKDPAFFEAEIFALLKEARRERDWYVGRRYDSEDGAYSLKIFVWPPGLGTRIHDHSSWGVYHCAVGSVLEEHYERIDDGSRAEHARLKKVWQLSWSPDDGASTVLPGDGGIHRVGNLRRGHGDLGPPLRPRMGEVDGRDSTLPATTSATGQKTEAKEIRDGRMRERRGGRHVAGRGAGGSEESARKVSTSID